MNLKFWIPVGALVLAGWGMNGSLRAATLPEVVKVLPVFFVPAGEAEPTAAQKTKLMQHLSWSRQRYYEMLKFRDTFTLATTTPVVYPALYPLNFYRLNLDGGGGASQYTAELMKALGYNRTNCPYVFVVVVMNPPISGAYPLAPGGRPINGGNNAGGGLIQMSTHDLDTPYLQSTLQHELGHSFGLPHVDSYGYSMTNNASIMSYDLSHRTSDFTPSSTPGSLNPEDFRALAANRRVFPVLYFDPATDVPANYTMQPVVQFGAMDFETGIFPEEIKQQHYGVPTPFVDSPPRNIHVNGTINCAPVYTPIGASECSLFVTGPYPGGAIPGGPFPKVTEGVTSALSGDILRLQGGAYNEQIRIVKAITLRSQSGTVVIGK